MSRKNTILILKRSKTFFTSVHFRSCFRDSLFCFFIILSKLEISKKQKELKQSLNQGYYSGFCFSFWGFKKFKPYTLSFRRNLYKASRENWSLDSYGMTNFVVKKIYISIFRFLRKSKIRRSQWQTPRFKNLRKQTNCFFASLHFLHCKDNNKKSV